MYLEPSKSGLLQLGAQQQVPRTENKFEMRDENKFEDHIEGKTEHRSENKAASRAENKIPQKSDKNDDKDDKDFLKKDKSKVIFLDALESLFLKMNLKDLNDDVKQPSIPFSPKNKNETQLDDMNLLINSMFTPSVLVQPNLNQNCNIVPQVQEKSQNLSIQNNSIKIDLSPLNNFELGDYHFFPISTDNLNISKTDLLNLGNEIPLQNLPKLDLVDLKQIKNEFNPYQNLFETKLEPVKNLQKGDLVILNSVEMKNNDVVNLFPKMNIEISNIEPNITLNDKNILNPKVVNSLDKMNENPKIVNFGNNFFGYPVYSVENGNSLKTDYYLIKKENTQEGENQVLLGILSKNNPREKQHIGLENNNQSDNYDIDQNQEINKLHFVKTKNNIEILSKVNFKNNNLLNQLVYPKDFSIQTDTLNEKNLFKIPTLEKKDINIIEKYIVTNEVNQSNSPIELKNSDSKNHLDSLQNSNENLKSKSVQEFGAFKFNNIANDKKVFDISRNIVNNEKFKIDFLRNKDIKDDSFFSFMSSDSGNDSTEDKNGIDEKANSDNKGILFEKGISSQHALPITVSDNSKSDFSNPLISAATRRAVDLSSQLQARGGGTAKIQIQDEKFGSIELSIHMKKDNTVTMEIKASDRDLKVILEKNSDTLKKSLDVQNISLTEFKVSTVEKSAQAGMGSFAGQGFSQQQSQQNSQASNYNSQDFSQQALNQGFSQNNFTNSSGQFFKNNADEFSFNKHANNSYISKSFSVKNMEKNSITNIQRGANGSIKVLV